MCGEKHRSVLEDFRIDLGESTSPGKNDFFSSETIHMTALGSLTPPPPIEIQVGLLTGGQDKSYATGLAMALNSRGVGVDFIGSDEVDDPELHSKPGINFLNLRGSQRRDASLGEKVSRILIYYGRLIRYAFNSKPKVFHILWNNKFELFDRTLLTLYYKLMGKKVVLTAHNVNAAKRDSKDSLLNRLGLRIQYHLVDHIFVHTEKMRGELVKDFGLREGAVSVIPFGINKTVLNSELTPVEARRRLGIEGAEKMVLFYGRIGPYKGLDYLLAAFQQICARKADYRLVIAGKPKEGATKYFEGIQQRLNGDATHSRVIQKIGYIPDEETELYFKAADVLVLPYTYVFQSGVLFLAYNFGLPVIATDVGSFGEDIVEGKTGFLCKASDANDLARTIEKYFESDLFKNLSTCRQNIRDFANQRYSWEVVGRVTQNVYAQLLGNDAA